MQSRLLNKQKVASNFITRVTFSATSLFSTTQGEREDMGYSHYWEWTPPIPNSERFVAWSRDIQRLLDALPRYIAAGRRQLTLVGAKREEITTGRAPLEISLNECEEYDEQKHGSKEQYLLFEYGEEGTAPIVIFGSDGTGNPTITDSLVAFNGDASQEEMYESFYVSKEELMEGNPSLEHKGFGACKTQGKPYDLLVTAALVRLAYYFPTMQISSDGGWPGMWEGSILCQEVFGVGVNPVKKDEDS